MNTRRAFSLLTLCGLTTMAACDDATGVDGPQNFSLLFSVSAPATSTPASRALDLSGTAAVVGPPMVLEGSNGTLTIDEIRLIVAEVELEGEDDNCPAGADDDCNEFEAPPRFLDLPLDGTPVEAMTGMIPAGVYDELEFEIEDIDDDEADDDFGPEFIALREAILAEFPEWPEDASAMVAGTFSSTATGDVAFRVFIEAEIEVERDLSPPLVIDETTEAVDLTVDIQPERWFVGNDGTVLDLSQYDWDATGMLLELEVEIEDGFAEIEVDDDS